MHFFRSLLFPSWPAPTGHLLHPRPRPTVSSFIPGSIWHLHRHPRLRPGIPGHGWHHQAMFSPKLCLSVPIFPFKPTFWVPTGTESAPTLPVGPANERFHLIPLIGQCQHTFFWSLAAVRNQWRARRWGLSEKGFMGETAIIYLGPMNLSPLK